MDSFSKYKPMFENFITGVVLHDRNTKVLYANSSALELLGLTYDQMLGKTVMDPHWRFIKEDGSDLPIADYPVSKVIQTKLELKNMVLGMIRSELAKPIWVICNAHPEFDEDGTVEMIIVSFSDITEQKYAEEKLAEQLSLRRALVDSMLDGFATIGADGSQLDLNPAFLKMTGFNREDLIGKKPPFPYWPPEEHENIQEALKNTLSGKSGNFELVFMRKNEDRFPVIVSSSAIQDQNGNVVMYIASVKDITSLKETERELKQTAEQLKSALESAEKAMSVKSRFMDTAAHELRTPVSSVSMLLQFMYKKFTKGTPVDSQSLERLMGQVDRISRLVVDLLDVSRLERGGLVMKKSSTNISKLVRDCVEEFLIREPNRKIVLKCQDEAMSANIDEVRIFQVLSNLIDNASKYSPLETDIEVSVEQSSDKILVSVKDKGEGIPVDDQATLFDPFYRGSSDSTENTNGLGLGLYICREIISLHGGEIGVKSASGAGSVFYYTIPLEQP
jgi:PAS domain S-box-containing protein